MNRIDEAFWQRVAVRRLGVMEELRAREAQANTVKELEALWHSCKFVVLEGDPAGYFRIRELFNRYRKHLIDFAELKQGVFGDFYNALSCPLSETNVINLLTHIWGYLKKHVKGEDDRSQALVWIGKLSEGDLSVTPHLYEFFDQLHVKYGKENLLNPTLRDRKPS